MHPEPPTPPFLESPHLRLAYELVAEESGLSQRVMRELVGRSRRFAELQPLGAGRRAGELTDALRHMEGSGLIERRTSQRQVPVVHTYELTALGTLAEGAMQRLRPVQAISGKPPKRQRSETAFARARDTRWLLDAK